MHSINSLMRETQFGLDPDPSRRRLIAAAFAVALLSTACGPGATTPNFKSTDITGSGVGGDFAMPDATGKLRNLSEFQGKVVLIFFGYTQCPDVCPTTLAEAAEALKMLGAKAKDVQVIFITVDPERDTPELLAQYVPAFHPSFIGLRGNAAELDRVAKQFKIFYAKSETPGGGYTMDHSASKFILDKQGRVRLLVQHAAGPAVLAHDLGQLLS